MKEKIHGALTKTKDNINRFLIKQQADALCRQAAAPQKNKASDKVGAVILALCMALIVVAMPAYADTAKDIADAIREAMDSVYSAMKNIGVVIAVIGVAASALILFFGGDKGMEKAKKALIYTAIGIGILFLAVPIIQFFVSMYEKNSHGLSDLKF